jgi:hypothetical protein
LKQLTIVALLVASVALVAIGLIGNQVDDRRQQLDRYTEPRLTADQVAVIAKRSICKEQGLTSEEYDQLLSAWEEANARLDHTWRIMSRDEQNYWLDIANDAAEKLGYADDQEEDQ